MECPLSVTPHRTADIDDSLDVVSLRLWSELPAGNAKNIVPPAKHYGGFQVLCNSQLDPTSTTPPKNNFVITNSNYDFTVFSQIFIDNHF